MRQLLANTDLSQRSLLKAVLAFLFLSQPASVLGSSVSASVDPALRIYAPVQSYQSMQRDSVVMQKHDYSCGAAAMATLMTYYFEDPTSEASLLELAKQFSDIDSESLKTKGLSLLNLKQLAESRGYRAMGVKLSPEQLSLLTGPILIHYRPKGYEHFAVFKGVKGGTGYIADPVYGNIRMSLDAFAADWDGTALALDKGGRLYSNTPLAVPAGQAQPEHNILRNLR